ncbi:MAG: GyrI-like domain-containing protein [Candidatus Aminicenantes bacterium]|nr:GyrI-like domain-containing protein [Candidatus Aminicenantes bacterium]
MKTAVMGAVLAVLAMGGVAGWAGGAVPAAEEFTVKDVAPFLYCSLPCKGPFTSMQQNIELLFYSMTSQSLAPLGPMLGVYYNDPETTKAENLKWEIGFPVSETNVLEPLVLKQWTFTTVVEALHIGPYETSSAKYAEIMAWIEANGYSVAGPIMEKYLSDPNSTRPEDLKTEIWVPVTKTEGRGRP